MGGYEYSALGSGIGSIGALEGTATESVFVTVLGQLGVLPGSAYLAATLYLITAAKIHWRPRTSFWAVFAVLMLTWAVSEQWLTFNAGWLLGLFMTTGATLVHDRGETGDRDSAHTAASRSKS
jgi:hypothetical protein